MTVEMVCPECGEPFEAEEGPEGAVCPRCGHDVTAEATARTEMLPPPSAQETLDAGPPKPSLKRDDEGSAQRTFSRYRILGELGRGGMGIVYKTYDPKLKRIVALKVLLSGEAASAEEVERFFREAESAAKLHHPNIVPIHELDIHEGKHFFTMDFIEGRPLSKMIKDETIPPRRAVEIIRDVALAAHHAHRQGVIHRDLKPANILLTEDGRPMVTDFGLAKQVQADSSLTQSGSALGTPSYMAPEQARGRVREIDARTDVYALGAVLYEMITDLPPFVGATPFEIMEKVAYDDPIPPRTYSRSCPTDVETICLKCLEKEPGRRYGSAKELADDCARYLDGEAIAARPPSALYRLSRTVTRHRELVAGLGVAAVIALAAGIAVYSSSGALEKAEAERKRKLEELEKRADECLRFGRYDELATLLDKADGLRGEELEDEEELKAPAAARGKLDAAKEELARSNFGKSVSSAVASLTIAPKLSAEDLKRLPQIALGDRSEADALRKELERKGFVARRRKSLTEEEHAGVFMTLAETLRVQAAEGAEAAQSAVAALGRAREFLVSKAALPDNQQTEAAFAILDANVYLSAALACRLRGDDTEALEIYTLAVPVTRDPYVWPHIARQAIELCRKILGWTDEEIAAGFIATVRDEFARRGCLTLLAEEASLLWRQNPDRTISAFEPSTGDEVWRFPPIWQKNARTFRQPTGFLLSPDRQTIYYGFGQCLFELDARTGVVKRRTMLGEFVHQLAWADEGAVEVTIWYERFRPSRRYTRLYQAGKLDKPVVPEFTVILWRQRGIEAAALGDTLWPNRGRRRRESSAIAGSCAGAVPYHVRLVRTGSTFTGYASPDGSSWQQLGKVAVQIADPVFVGLPVTSHVSGTLCEATFDSVQINGAPLQPWQDSDVGSVKAAGSAGSSAGTFTVNGDGRDIWNQADAFHFIYRSVTGDCEITARVKGLENTHEWAKAGVMIRDTLDESSRHVMVVVTPGHDISMQYRAETPSRRKQPGYEEGLEIIRREMERDPTNPFYLKVMADWHKRHGKEEAARQALLSLIEDDSLSAVEVATLVDFGEHPLDVADRAYWKATDRLLAGGHIPGLAVALIDPAIFLRPNWKAAQEHGIPPDRWLRYMRSYESLMPHREGGYYDSIVLEDWLRSQGRAREADDERRRRAGVEPAGILSFAGGEVEFAEQAHAVFLAALAALVLGFSGVLLRSVRGSRPLQERAEGGARQHSRLRTALRPWRWVAAHTSRPERVFFLGFALVGVLAWGYSVTCWYRLSVYAGSQISAMSGTIGAPYSIRFFEEKAKEHPGPEASFVLGCHYLWAGEYENAEGAFAKVLEAGPHARALNNLGVIAEGRGRTEEALSRYREAAGLPPPSPEALYNLSRLQQDGDLPDRARALAPDLVERHVKYHEGEPMRAAFTREERRRAILGPQWRVSLDAMVRFPAVANMISLMQPATAPVWSYARGMSTLLAGYLMPVVLLILAFSVWGVKADGFARGPSLWAEKIGIVAGALVPGSRAVLAGGNIFASGITFCCTWALANVISVREGVLSPSGLSALCLPQMIVGSAKDLARLLPLPAFALAVAPVITVGAFLFSWTDAVLAWRRHRERQRSLPADRRARLRDLAPILRSALWFLGLVPLAFSLGLVLGWLGLLEPGYVFRVAVVCIAMALGGLFLGVRRRSAPHAVAGMVVGGAVGASLGALTLNGIIGLWALLLAPVMGLAFLGAWLSPPPRPWRRAALAGLLAGLLCFATMSLLMLLRTPDWFDVAFVWPPVVYLATFMIFFALEGPFSGHWKKGGIEPPAETWTET